MVRHWTELPPNPAPSAHKADETPAPDWRDQRERAQKLRKDIAQHWPLLLCREQALAYVGLPEKVFDQQIRPLIHGRKLGKAVYFSRLAIDDVVDRFWGAPDPAQRAKRARSTQRALSADLKRQQDEVERIIDAM